MIFFDRLVVGGLRFVLDKVQAAADSELSNPDRLREELLAAQMQFELGEIDEAQLAHIEEEVFARLRELRAQEAPGVLGGGGLQITGAEIEIEPFEDDATG